MKKLGCTFRKSHSFNQSDFLSQEEETGLWARWVRNNDYAARDKLILAFRPLNYATAREIIRLNQYHADLFQELLAAGNMRLLDICQVKKFDPELGRFSTYAKIRLYETMIKFVMDYKLPVKLQTTKPQRTIFNNHGGISAYIDQAFPSITPHARLEKMAQLMPRVRQSTLLTKICIADIVEFEAKMESAGLSVNGVNAAPDALTTLIDDVMAPYGEATAILEQEDESRIWKHSKAAIKILPQRSQDIVQQRYLSATPKTLQELSLVYNVSLERIRQIEVQALQRMRAYMEDYQPPKRGQAPDAIKRLLTLTS